MAGTVSLRSRFAAWRLRQRVTPEDRRRVLQAVTIRANEGWWLRFGVMFALSVVIAATGLSQNSTAVVIGAMLVAPLMGPILGLAASLAMGSWAGAWRTFSVVAIAAVGGVALAWLLAGLWSGDPLTREVLARTSPDIRDLVVALAAGSAGAYATIREDISGSLPGAGVAVALVPPLASVGLTLRAGRSDLSQGALLLFAANVTAIVLAAVVVFLATGFVPASLIARRRHRVRAGTALAVVLAVGVAFPLVVATNRLARSSRSRTAVDAAVRDWLTGTDLELTKVIVQNDAVIADIVGSSAPPDPGDLEAQLRTLLSRSVSVQPRWTQRTVALTSLKETTLNAEKVRSLVGEWLGSPEAVITSLSVDASTVTLDIKSDDPPPPAGSLASYIFERTGAGPSVNIHWTQRTRPPETDGTRNRALAVISEWRRLNPRAADVVSNLDVTRARVGTESEIAVIVDEGSETLVVDFVGEQPPVGIETLRSRLAESFPSRSIVLRFTQRSVLTVPTSTIPTLPAPLAERRPDAFDGPTPTIPAEPLATDVPPPSTVTAPSNNGLNP